MYIAVPHQILKLVPNPAPRAPSGGTPNWGTPTNVKINDSVKFTVCMTINVFMYTCGC